MIIVLTMESKFRVSIVGASGYGGGELLRLLLMHPNVEVKQVTSRKYAKFPVTVVHPNMRGVTNLRFTKPDDLEKCDLLFLAMPNGKSQENIDRYMELAEKVIDLGADFRLSSEEEYNKWYGEHQRSDLINKFTYGIAELHREEITDANYVACGGCEATCSILTLYPLFKNGLVELDRTVIDAKLGSSAAGAKASGGSHHPERAGVVRSYKPTMHRHTAEIEQELMGNVQVSVSATAIEMVRGILVTTHSFLKDVNITEQDIWNVYRDEYRKEPFIRLINDKMGNYRFPEPKLLQGTNYCDIGLQKDAHSNRVVVIGAIDNLVKGTAGQAIQAMNIMQGWKETLGLEYFGLHPV